MKNNFEQEFNRLLNEEKEMPSIVRKSLDHSYDVIRMNAKKKKRNVMWRKFAAAACCLVVAGSVFTNEHVRANINKLFNFNDEGIERAVDEEFPQKAIVGLLTKGLQWHLTVILQMRIN